MRGGFQDDAYCGVQTVRMIATMLLCIVVMAVKANMCLDGNHEENVMATTYARPKCNTDVPILMTEEAREKRNETKD